MGPDQIVTATAKGGIFACASADKVGAYDVGTFGWTDLPGVSGITRLEVSKSLLWALNQSGDLFVMPLQSLKGQKDWDRVAQNVKDIATTLDTVYVLSKEPDLPTQVCAYSGEDGSRLFAIAPQPLKSQQTQWRFAAVFGDDLVLAGDDNALHRYSLKTRHGEFLFAGNPPVGK
jgi:hypothetical protein